MIKQRVRVVGMRVETPSKVSVECLSNGHRFFLEVHEEEATLLRIGHHYSLTIERDALEGVE